MAFKRGFGLSDEKKDEDDRPPHELVVEVVASVMLEWQKDFYKAVFWNEMLPRGGRKRLFIYHSEGARSCCETCSFTYFYIYVFNVEATQTFYG